MTTTDPSFQNAVELLAFQFLEICDNVRERTVSEKPDGFVVTFAAGDYQGIAVRLCRTEQTITIGFHRSSIDANHSTHADNRFLTCGVNLMAPSDSSVSEPKRGHIFEQRFFDTHHTRGLGGLRMSHLKGLPYLIQFMELVLRFQYDYAWESEIVESWFAAMKRIREATQSVASAA